MGNIELELGYYWVEWKTQNNWLIFWFNGGYWQCVAMGRIELNDKNIISIDTRKLTHLRKPGNRCKLDVCPDCGAEFQIVYGTIKMGDVLFEIEIEYCPECGFIKNTTAKRKD